MIRTEVIANTRTLDNSMAYARAFADYVETPVLNVFETRKPQLLDDLRRQPGAVKYPILWTSERQRKAYFATNGFGNGIPYKRTGRMSRGWYAWARRSGNRFEMTIANSTPGARFVYGDIRPRADKKDPQQRFHRNTGWTKVAPKIESWVSAYRIELEAVLRKAAVDMVTKS